MKYKNAKHENIQPLTYSERLKACQISTLHHRRIVAVTVSVALEDLAASAMTDRSCDLEI